MLELEVNDEYNINIDAECNIADRNANWLWNIEVSTELKAEVDMFIIVSTLQFLICIFGNELSKVSRSRTINKESSISGIWLGILCLYFNNNEVFLIKK